MGMNVKLKIPTNLDDITVGQYQKIRALLSNEDLESETLDNEILKIVLNFDNVDAISVKDKKEITTDIREALEREGEFKNTFTLNGIKFGLIPNFDRITNGEYTDLIKYSKEEEDLHRLLAVSYRPIAKKDGFDNYLVEDYKGTSEHAETMKNLPMSIANGVVGFFLTLSNDLEAHTLRCMEEERVRVMML